MKKLIATAACAGLLFSPSYSAKVKSLKIVDQSYLMVEIMDSEVQHTDDGIGKDAFSNHPHDDTSDVFIEYLPLLNTANAQDSSKFTIKSTDDATFGVSGVSAAKVYRKTKLNGHGQNEWISSESDYRYTYSYTHTLFIELPDTLTSGSSYTLEIASDVNADSTSITFDYDFYTSNTEAVKVNLVGYSTDNAIKGADLYMWMGDGGPRDYTSFVGNKVYLYNLTSKAATEVGTVSYTEKNADDDVRSRDLTKSKVWHVDFTGHSTPGTYCLAVEGIGCSQPFEIAADIYHDPFQVSVLGFFYMRIGVDSTGIYPVPRQPRYIPGEDPSAFKVTLTTMHPFHDDWSSFSSGDAWDNPYDWTKFLKEGNPTNPNAYGGHSDALDWDRHLGHISIIYDMLLSYYLTGGAASDDDLGIPESGNGIPDILDEAREEVDFWLRLRDGEGYSHGLTNPRGDNMYQAGTTTYAAWANAANAAMLADCFRIAGKADLMYAYRDSAILAFHYASWQEEDMLDEALSVGDSYMTGADLKMTAAAYLYNLTGETKYEDIVNELSIVTDGESAIEYASSSYGQNQVWATAGYLKTPRTVNYTTLHTNMKASIVFQANKKEAGLVAKRRSRRATDNRQAWFRSGQNVHRTLIAHAVSSGTVQNTMLDALYLEADYGLGRNPMNMIEMTTQTTSLAHKRSVEGAYTSGWDDGAPGVHPGHTPYMNLETWWDGMVMSMPPYLYENSYPADFKNTWPIGEGYFNTRYIYAANEFTPQQSMRGKMALYTYLHSLSGTPATSVALDDIKAVDLVLAVAPEAPKLQPLSGGQYYAHVYSLDGSLAWEGSVRADAGAQHLTPNFAPLTHGSYLVRLVNEHESRTLTHIQH